MEDPRDYRHLYDEQEEDVVCWGTDSDDTEMGESLVPCTTSFDEEPEVVERVGLRATHVVKRKRERGILEGSDEVRILAICFICFCLLQMQICFLVFSLLLVAAVL